MSFIQVSLNIHTQFVYIPVIQCPDLSDTIENGKVLITPTARTVNSTAEYSCDGGYKLDKGDTKRTCQAGGTWSGEAPECSESEYYIPVVVYPFQCWQWVDGGFMRYVDDVAQSANTFTMIMQLVTTLLWYSTDSS